MQMDDLRRRKLLTAILDSPTLLEAFEKAGVSPPTGYKILKEASFQEELRDASRQVYDSTIARLASTSTKAFEVLAKSLDSENEHVALKAALGYFGLMSNPKLMHNDQEITELKRFVETWKSAVNKLDPSTRKVVKNAFVAAGGGKAEGKEA